MIHGASFHLPPCQRSTGRVTLATAFNFAPVENPDNGEKAAKSSPCEATTSLRSASLRLWKDACSRCLLRKGRTRRLAVGIAELRGRARQPPFPPGRAALAMNRDLDGTADAGPFGLVMIAACCRISLDQMRLAEHMTRDMRPGHDGKMREIVGHGLARRSSAERPGGGSPRNPAVSPCLAMRALRSASASWK